MKVPSPPARRLAAGRQVLAADHHARAAGGAAARGHATGDAVPVGLHAQHRRGGRDLDRPLLDRTEARRLGNQPVQPAREPGQHEVPRLVAGGLARPLGRIGQRPDQHARARDRLAAAVDDLPLQRLGVRQADRRGQALARVHVDAHASVGVLGCVRAQAIAPGRHVGDVKRCRRPRRARSPAGPGPRCARRPGRPTPGAPSPRPGRRPPR